MNIRPAPDLAKQANVLNDCDDRLLLPPCFSASVPLSLACSAVSAFFVAARSGPCSKLHMIVS